MAKDRGGLARSSKRLGKAGEGWGRRLTNQARPVKQIVPDRGADMVQV